MEVGGTVTLLGDIEPHVKPVGTVSVNDIVPEKLPVAATVIVEVAEVLTVTAEGEVADIVKSLVKLNVAVVE